MRDGVTLNLNLLIEQGELIVAPDELRFSNVRATARRSQMESRNSVTQSRIILLASPPNLRAEDIALVDNHVVLALLSVALGIGFRNYVVELVHLPKESIVS